MEAIKKTWWLFAGIFLLWVFYPFIISSDLIKVWKPWMDWTLRGQLGDSFGALNTLFSGLALAGLAVNIYLQGVQIKKLEEKEQQNEDLLKQQVAVMRQTALLQYYNEMISQIEQQVFELELQHQTGMKEFRNGPFASWPSNVDLVSAARVLGKEHEIRELGQIEARLKTRKTELDKQKDRRRALLTKLNAED